MKKTLTSVLALALATALVLPGCTDPDTKDLITKETKESENGLQKVTHPDVPEKHYNPLVVSDKIWAGNTATHMTQGFPLPERFEGTRGITMVSTEPMTAVDILRSIQDQTGVIVHYGDFLLHAGRAAGGRGANNAGGAGDGGEEVAQSMPVAYEGPLSGLLNRMSDYFGISWHYDGTAIYIAHFETKVFTVEALPGDQQVHDGMQDDNSTQGVQSGAAGGAGGGGNSQQNSVTQNSRFSIDLKYWEELEKVINSMLGGVGTAVVSPSLGTVTVTTTPRTMQMIADYLQEENQRISKQIAVNVEIYSVTLTKGMDFNIAFNTALRRIADFTGNFVGAAAPPATTVSTFTGGGALSLAILNPHDHTGEVNDVFNALQGIGNTTKVATFPLITLNNRPVSRRIGEDISYVAEATTNTTGSGTTSTFAGTSLTPGTVHQGFSVQLTPRLLDDGRILLQYSLSIIDVLSITSFNSVCGSSSSNSSSACSSSDASAQGSSTIELPTTSNKIFVQQSVLKSGSTLFIGGADETDAQQNSQGVTDPEMYALGGGLASGTSRTMVFFALTPQVLETPHSEQD